MSRSLPASSRPPRRPRRTERISRPRPWPAITDDTKGADFKKGEVQVTEGGN